VNCKNIDVEKLEESDIKRLKKQIEEEPDEPT